MSGFKFLIDTNVVIGLEDASPVRAILAEVVRLSSEYQIGLFVDGANYDDVSRDKDSFRRSITLSKLNKFQKLREIPSLSHAELTTKFGEINNARDHSDVRFLLAIEAKAVDFLITEDNELHQRADRAGLGAHVFTVEEALGWLKQTFLPKKVALPYVIERKAYEIDLAAPIFNSLRSDYSGFDAWFDKCRRSHRDCWVLEIDREIAGIIIRKDETHSEAHTHHSGPKILKICTFKVRDEYRGEKFGELLLKQVLWFAQQNSYDLVYLTAYPKHDFMISFLSQYGFEKTKEAENGEWYLEKKLARGSLPLAMDDPVAFCRKYYPRFDDRKNIRKFCVPIRPEYHRRLFPEIALAAELPLFPKDIFGLTLTINSQEGRTPGNTIRKVYLCRAKIKTLCPGGLIFFYMSKGEEYAASQSITTVAVIEQILDANKVEDLIRFTARRSVFSAEELGHWIKGKASPVRMIDFLLIGHIDPPISLEVLLKGRVFNKHPPQSIIELSNERYDSIRPFIKLGFDF